MPSAVLADRAFLRVSGEDAASFLQGLVTADLMSLPDDLARQAALLTPQGKIQFEFLVARSDGGFSLETSADQAAQLEKRLTLYRLRAKVSFARQTETATEVAWGDMANDGARDERFDKAGVSLTRKPVAESPREEAAYHALRQTLGLAEAGIDYPLSDAFPHDALYDVSGGVSFRKGCYVGQEVVSRMQHRSTARRRVVVVSGMDALPPAGTALTINGREIGTMGGSTGTTGLAIARIDRIGAGLLAGETLMAGEVVVTASLPGWTGLRFPDAAEAEA